MFKVSWNKVNNGVKLVAVDGVNLINGSPRPVFYEELDFLGFNKYWKYPHSKNPLLWAVERRYYNKGICVAEVKGGNYYDDPQICLTSDGEGLNLSPIDIKKIIADNEESLFLLEQEALEFVHHTYKMYGGLKGKEKDSSELDWGFATARALSEKTKIPYTVVRQTCGSMDIIPLDDAKLKNKPEYKASKADKFVISFSGGKDSQVTLDLITRVIPPSDFTVIYSDTGLEIPPSIQIFSDTEKFYKSRYPDIKFHLTSNQQNIFSYWEKIGAPTRMHRWCCAVMKTGPFYRYLKSISPDKKQPRVLVFEGVRAEESNKRSTYSRIGVGVKHSTVVNARPIFNWNTTEIFLYLLKYGLPINDGYRRGLTRVGCSVCPLSSEWSEHIIHKLYPEKVNKYLDILSKQTAQIGLTTRNEIEEYIKIGNWKKRAGGNSIGLDSSRIDIIANGLDLKAVLLNPKEDLFEWLKVLGRINITQFSNNKYIGELKYINRILFFTREDIALKAGGLKIALIFKNICDDILLTSIVKKVLYKATYCIHCEVCEVECPTGALSVVPKVSVDFNKCVHCLRCLDINEKGCIMAKSINTSEGNGVKSQMKTSGIDKYSTFGLKEKWVRNFFKNSDSYFETGNNDLGVKMIPAAINWLRDAELMNRKEKTISELGLYLKGKYSQMPDVVWEIIWTNFYYNSGIIASYVNRVPWGKPLSKKELLILLKDDYSNISEATILNPIGALLNMLSNTPLGSSVNVGTIIKKGNAVASITREPYLNVSAATIAYSLYKIAEATGRYDFRLSEFYSNITKGGANSLFGTNEEQLKMLLRGLQENRNAIIRVDLEKGLDNIKLREDYNSLQVLKFILG